MVGSELTWRAHRAADNDPIRVRSGGTDPVAVVDGVVEGGVDPVVVEEGTGGARGALGIEVIRADVPGGTERPRGTDGAAYVCVLDADGEEGGEAGPKEHVLSVRSINVPPGQIVVEGRCLVEHGLHRRDIARVPRPQRLVKGGC